MAQVEVPRLRFGLACWHILTRSASEGVALEVIFREDSSYAGGGDA